MPEPKQPSKAQSRTAAEERQDGDYAVPVLAEPKGGPVPSPAGETPEPSTPTV